MRSLRLLQPNLNSLPPFKLHWLSVASVTPLVESLAEITETGTRDPHSDALVTELTNHFEKCQQLLNSISGSLSTKAMNLNQRFCHMEHYLQAYVTLKPHFFSKFTLLGFMTFIHESNTTVEGQKRKLEETKQQLNQRRELISKYRSSIEELVTPDSNR
ncbi:uncharacterized protein A4U43_C08F4940 [Asparagus officinalis]|nr:uncharacterized protein A4U43_C08F4940 [Asparagus officinalis]